MPAENELPEPDQLEGTPHPREQPAFFGHSAAETAFRDGISLHRELLAAHDRLTAG